MNNRKNKLLKYVWFKNDTEYIRLIESCKNNDDVETLKIIKDIVYRGDI